MSRRGKMLYLFDVDGTLTKPRQAITEHLKSFLIETVKPVVSVGLVSGSDYVKIAEQMTGESEAAKFDYVFCENGLVHYKNGKLVSKESILNHLGEQKLQRLINFSLGYLSKIELPAKRGNFIEFRSGLVNICPVGRSCSQEEREQFAVYDAEHKIREKLVQVLQQEFVNFNLTFALGGQISIDVFPNGWDKTYCLNHVADAKFEEIHFFGDKTGPGGNDHEIFSHEATIGHTVTSPDDTREQLRKLLGIA